MVPAWPRRRWVHGLTATLVALPLSAVAQSVTPTTPAHPGLPWALGVAIPQGQLIRYIYVPPLPVTLQYLVVGPPPSEPPAAEPAPPVPQTPPGPGSPPPGTPSVPAAVPGSAPGAPSERAPEREPAPPAGTAAPELPPVPQIVSQQVIVPGYYVRETTVGFHYPDRWTVEQVAPNTYRWRQLPAQFVPK